MAESFENLENIYLTGRTKMEKKSFAEALDRYLKQGEERKTRFYVENDLKKEQSQSSAFLFFFLLYVV